MKALHHSDRIPAEHFGLQAETDIMHSRYPENPAGSACRNAAALVLGRGNAGTTAVTYGCAGTPGVPVGGAHMCCLCFLHPPQVCSSQCTGSVDAFLVVGVL